LVTPFKPATTMARPQLDWNAVTSAIQDHDQTAPKAADFPGSRTAPPPTRVVNQEEEGAETRGATGAREGEARRPGTSALAGMQGQVGPATESAGEGHQAKGRQGEKGKGKGKAAEADGLGGNEGLEGTQAGEETVDTGRRMDSKRDGQSVNHGKAGPSERPDKKRTKRKAGPSTTAGSRKRKPKSAELIATETDGANSEREDTEEPPTKRKKPRTMPISLTKRGQKMIVDAYLQAPEEKCERCRHVDAPCWIAPGLACERCRDLKLSCSRSEARKRRIDTAPKDPLPKPGCSAPTTRSAPPAKSSRSDPAPADHTDHPIANNSGPAQVPSIHTFTAEPPTTSSGPSETESRLEALEEELRVLRAKFLELATEQLSLRNFIAQGTNQPGASHFA
jgi:hypothetical protein